MEDPYPHVPSWQAPSRNTPALLVPATLLYSLSGQQPVPSPHDMSFLPQLPWKSLTSIIEYYYMWKTTDRYVQQVRPRQSPQHPHGWGPRGFLCLGFSADFRITSQKSSRRRQCWRQQWSLSIAELWTASLLTSLNPLFCFKKRLKAAEAESKLKQVYIPN